MKKILIIWAAMLPFFVFSGCSEDEKEELRLISVELSDKDVVLDVGDTFQFEVIATPSDFPVDKYEWTVVSKDGKGDGRIDRDGLFTATKAGVVYVEVLTPNILNGNIPFYDNTTVEIRGEDDADGEEEPEEETPAISGISFSPSSLSLKKGDSSYIDYSVQPANADASGIRWNESDNSIISITSTTNERINISALKAGNTEIYTTVKGKRYACQVTVESVKVERISIEPAKSTLTQGETMQLEVTTYPDNADDVELIYESSDVNIARISSNGYITAINPGVCTMTVSTKDGSIKANCEITVIEKGIEDLVELQAGVSIKLYNNGYLTGKLSANIINHSDKRIKMVSFYMYDTQTNQSGKMDFEEKYIEPFGNFSMTLEFSEVYKPMFEWVMECGDETFSKTYVSLY